MKGKRSWLIPGILLATAILIRILSADPVWVEYSYSQGIYPSVSSLLRYISGWAPFSFGDILYGLVIIWLLWKIIKSVRAVLKKQVTRRDFINGSLKAITMVLTIYVVFNAFWGINYNRMGIAAQLKLPVQKYTAAELANINLLLLQKVNECKVTMLKNDQPIAARKEILNAAAGAYTELAKTLSFLTYSNGSVKSSLWGWFGNYGGFTGYYNPFTGEAQVNTSIPKFLQPFTACHEIAHQLGYAKENEANFVGYLAATASKEAFFHYSAYLDLFLYANRNLYNIDSTAARSLAKQLSPGIKKDLKEWKDFNLRHKSFIEPVIRWGYGKYLQSNQQPSGVLSYDEVTGLLIAYYKKYGKI